MEIKSKYPVCDHFDKKQPEEPISKEIRDSISKDFRVLPMYEKAMADHAFSKTHSLQSNKFLHCRWLEYQRINIIVKPDPFKFPNVNDYHFYNYNSCYKPELSIIARPTNRFMLRDGPGVDKYGIIPISSDIGFRKSGMMVHKMKKNTESKAEDNETSKQIIKAEK